MNIDEIQTRLKLIQELDMKLRDEAMVTELIKKGLITEAARVTCFVLGSKVEQTENSDTTHWDGRVTIRPMSYDVVIRSRGEEDARPKGTAVRFDFYG